jgi:hypothetical protein
LAVDRRPPQAAVAKSDAGERCGKRRDKIPAGTVEGGERKRTAAEVSKADEPMSDPRGDPPPGSAWGMPKDCPSDIRHVGGAKLDLACVWNVRTLPAMPREKTEAATAARSKVPMRGRGAQKCRFISGFLRFCPITNGLRQGSYRRPPGRTSLRRLGSRESDVGAHRLTGISSWIGLPFLPDPLLSFGEGTFLFFARTATARRSPVGHSAAAGSRRSGRGRHRRCAPARSSRSR